MKLNDLVVVLIIGCSLLSACQPAQIPATDTATSAPSIITPTQTSAPLATATAIPTNTPLPKGVLFRDDFRGALQPGWKWENENPAKWTFTKDGWLQIIGEHDALLKENRQNNLLWYPLPVGDFIVTVHLKTQPFENFQQAAIFIYQDPDNYVTINRGYCALCSTGGNGFYMDYKIGGSTGDYSAATNEEDVYMRLESRNKSIAGYYATDPDHWTPLGRFGNYFQFKKVGIGVSNVRSPDDVVGLFDYFEISLP